MRLPEVKFEFIGPDKGRFFLNGEEIPILGFEFSVHVGENPTIKLEMPTENMEIIVPKPEAI